jgi:hypothetical protein
MQETSKSTRQAERTARGKAGLKLINGAHVCKGTQSDWKGGKVCIKGIEPLEGWPSL